MRTLSRGEQKSLAYHRVVANKLRDDPALIALAKQRLEWYRLRNPHSARYYDEWEKLLSGPLDLLVQTMIGVTDEACALRQENPFVDLVSQTERARIYASVAAAIDGGQSA